MALSYPLLIKVKGELGGEGRYVCRNAEEVIETMKVLFTEKRFGDPPTSLTVASLYEAK